MLGPNGGSSGLIEGRLGERCGGNGGRGGSMSGVGEGKVDSMGGIGGRLLALRSMVSNDGRGRGGLVIEGGSSSIGAEGGEVNGGVVDFGVSKRFVLIIGFVLFLRSTTPFDCGVRDYYSEDQYTVSIKEDTAYPCLHSPRTTEDKAQYAVSRETQYTVFKIWNEYNILEDIKHGPYSRKSLIRRQFLKKLRENTFSGSDNEDANEHIEKVLEIIDLFHVPNINVDQLMLLIFPISLTGAEKPVETLYQAWERFKELLMKCPRHYLTEMQEVILFYNGLDILTRQILDSRGVISSKTVADAKVSIQEMAEYSQKWHNRTSRGRSTESSDGLAAIQA
ncbi:hypothetical protein Tco_0109352 [Tanacetum coccineum]